MTKEICRIVQDVGILRFYFSHDHYMHDIIQNYASKWEGVIELIQELLSDTVELVQSDTWVFRHPVTQFIFLQREWQGR
jgi:hypothetical protein